MTKRKRLIALLLTVVMISGLLTPYTTKTEAADSDQTYEYVEQFIAECLARLGRGYVTGGGHAISGLTAGDRFDCSGLIASAMKAVGFPCPGTQQNSSYTWNNWGRTIDWNNWMASKSNGQVLTFTTSDGRVVRYKVVKPTSSEPFVSNGQYTTTALNYFSVPGTLIFKMAPGESSGHLTVSLGRFNLAGLSVTNATSRDKMEEWVRQSLIARYADKVAQTSYAKTNQYSLSSSLATLLAKGGKNNVYKHEAVWEYRERSEFASKTYYNPIWQIDSLNDTTGVTVNNNFYGKDMTGTVMGVLVPDIDLPEEFYGNVGVKKVDSYGNPLSQVMFDLYARVDGTYSYVGRAQTNVNGEAVFNGTSLRLKEGETYYVKESAGKNGFYTDLQTYTSVTIKANTTSWIGANSVVVNDNWVSSIEITKSDPDGNALEGAEFTIYQWSKASNAYVEYCTVPWDVEAKKYIKTGIPYTEDSLGQYYVVESKAPPGHSKGDEEWIEYFVVTDDNNTPSDNAPFTYSLVNTPWERELIVVKSDASSGELLTGATFTLYQYNDTTGQYESVCDLTDNGDGTYSTLIVFNAINKTGSYKLVETNPPIGYADEGWEQEFVWGGESEWPSEPFEVDVENTPSSFEANLNKTDVTTGENVNIEEGRETGSYDLYADSDIYIGSEKIHSAGDLIANVVLSNDGIGHIDGLGYGDYYWIEHTAPFGYEADLVTKIPFTIAVDDEVSNKHWSTAVDVPIQYGDLSIYKYDETIGLENSILNNAGLQGAKFELYVGSASITDYRGNVLKYNGVALNANTLVGTYTTDADGKIFVSELPSGNYILKEVAAPFGFSVSSANITVKMVAGENTTINVANKLSNASITLTKKDKSGSPVADALYGLFVKKSDYNALSYQNASGSTVYLLTKVSEYTHNGTAYVLLTTAKTSAAGEIAFSGLRAGIKYYVLELEAPTGYVLDTKMYELDLTTKLSAALSVTDDKNEIISTEASTQKLVADHQGSVSGQVTIYDTVYLSGKTFGANAVTISGVTTQAKSYMIMGKLYDKETGKALNVNGATAFTVVTNEMLGSQNEIVLQFTIDASALAGKTIVVFEDLYETVGNLPIISSHSDINDAKQSIYFPSIETELNTSIRYEGSATPFTDTVHFTNLIVGKTYVIESKLYNATNKTMVDMPTAHYSFTATATSMQIDVSFSVNTMGLAGNKLVAYEYLYDTNGNLIIAEADATNLAQTEILDQPVSLPNAGGYTELILFLFALAFIATGVWVGATTFNKKTL